MIALCLVGDDCRGLDQAGNQIPPRDVWDRGYLCGVCRSRLGRWVAELPALVEALSDALLPGATWPPRFGSSRPDAWPVNPAALGLSGHIYGVLASWTKLVTEERGHTPPHANPGHAGVTLLAAWLTLHVDWLAHQRWADEIYREIGDLRREAFRAAYPSRRYRHIPVGDCPHCGDGLVHVLLPREEREPWTARCVVCGHQWDPWQLHSLQRALAAGA